MGEVINYYLDDSYSRFKKGKIYMRVPTSFPLLVHYRGEQHLTIVYKPDELKEGVAFIVIETQCQ